MTAKRIDEIVDEYLDEAGRPKGRHERVRFGERAPIPTVVRLSVYLRDGYNCRRCGVNLEGRYGQLELDHILPWSAGGGDHSSNLRTLCKRCNQERSNWNDGDHEREMVPTTWWCQTCWLAPDLEDPAEPLDGPGQRKHRARWRDGTYLNAVPWVREMETLAYCAWCTGYGYTDRAFTAAQQQELIAMTTPTQTDERGSDE